MAMTAANMVDRIEAYMGWSSPSVAQSALALQYLNGGYKEVLRGIWMDERGMEHFHAFSFAQPKETAADLTLWGGFAAGALTVSGTGNTILTSATAVFYPTMVGATITGDTSAVDYTIVTFTSSKIVVVSANASADTKFTMAPDGVNRLPSDWGGSLRGPVYANSTEVGDKLVEVTPEEMDELYRNSDTESIPTHWCIVPGPLTTAAAPTVNMRVHPPPSEDLEVNWPYRAIQADFTDAAVYPIAGSEHDPTILAFGLAEAERAKHMAHGTEWIEAQRLLRGSVEIDRQLRDSEFITGGSIQQE